MLSISRRHSRLLGNAIRAAKGRVYMLEMECGTIGSLGKAADDNDKDNNQRWKAHLGCLEREIFRSLSFV